jgi:phospholipid/cholesterol/gamma-HCH transport system substrate-binding protein
MKTTSAGIKLIIFMVVTSLMTFVLAATIGNFGGGSTTTYKVAFTDVTGLLPGNEVRIAGVRVGKVSKVSLAKVGACKDQAVAADLPNQLGQVTIQLDNGQKITDADSVHIRYRNLVGERYIAITEDVGSGKDARPKDLICPTKRPDDAVRTTPALDLTVLFNGFKPLFQALDPKTVNDVSYEIVQTLQGEGSTIDDLLAHTASLTTTLANKDAVIGRVVDNLTTVLDTLDKRDTDLNALILQLRRFAEGFAADRKEIGSSIVGIGKLTDATAGLLGDIRPSVKTDIGQLQTLAHTLKNNNATVKGVIDRLPDKLNRIISTATYGGWFNFYLCGLALTRPDGNGGQTVVTSVINTAARCKI